MNVLSLHGMFHLTAPECTFFSGTHRTVSSIELTYLHMQTEEENAFSCNQDHCVVVLPKYLLCHWVLNVQVCYDGSTHMAFFDYFVLLWIGIFAINMKTSFVFLTVGVSIWREVSVVEKSWLISNSGIQVIAVAVLLGRGVEDMLGRVTAGVTLNLID